MATAQTTMEFDKGVYRTGKNTMDATGVPDAIIKAVQTAGTALIAAANAPKGKAREMPAPYLYKIVVNGASVKFIGSQGDIKINVNLLEQPPAESDGKKE
jgi:hypothetical protein